MFFYCRMYWSAQSPTIPHLAQVSSSPWKTYHNREQTFFAAPARDTSGKDAHGAIRHLHAWFLNESLRYKALMQTSLLNSYPGLYVPVHENYGPRESSKGCRHASRCLIDLQVPECGFFSDSCN